MQLLLQRQLCERLPWDTSRVDGSVKRLRINEHGMARHDAHRVNQLLFIPHVTDDLSHCRILILTSWCLLSESCEAGLLEAD
jgi:hypothetical protein